MDSTATGRNGPGGQPSAPLEVDRPAGDAAPRPGAGPVRKPGGEPPDELEGHLVSLLAPDSFEAEQYRRLCHVVERMHKETGLRVLAVTSPGVGDGKTTTAINLAGVLAQEPEARVLLVDADLRRSSVRGLLGLGDPGLPGLVNAILDPALALADVVHRHPRFNLSVLPAGRGSAAPWEVLKSARLGELLEEARRQYDYVVLDTPPVLPVPDPVVIAKWVDGFLMVVSAHRTPRKMVEEALNVMEPDKTLGLVFNRDDGRLSGYYGYYYAYSGSAGDQRRKWWRREAKKSVARTGAGIHPPSRPS